MIKKLFEKIEEYNTIIIHRHSRPYGDALGSQIGLAKTLKYRYPNKEIYIVGDESKKYAFFGKMDEIEDEKFPNNCRMSYYEKYFGATIKYDYENELIYINL